jgi:hypothetical protein
MADDIVGVSISLGNAISLDINGTNSPQSFLTLTDTPDSYSGKSGNIIRVNSTENGLEFSTSSTVVTWGSITGDITSQSDLQTILLTKANLSEATFLGDISVPVGNKIYLDRLTDTYIIYNPSTQQLEFYVGGQIKQGFG